MAPRSDKAEVDATAKAWASLWQASDEYRMPDFSGADDEVLQPLTAEDLRRAASSFPIETGLGADNVAPRAMLRLANEQLQELAELMTLAESTGNWSEAISLVLIVLLPKDGGFRPMGSSRL